MEFEWKVKSKDCYRDVSWTVDHVLYGYYLFDIMNLDDLGKYSEVNEASFHIQCSNTYGGRLECRKVKKCGIRILYAEDKEEEEPHPKRLIYSSTPSLLVLFG